MRVGIVTEWSSRGAGFVGKQYAQALESQGGDVFVYARGDQEAIPSENWSGSHVHKATPCRNRQPKAIYAPDFIDWIEQHHLDVILFNEQHWMPPVLWARKLGVKTAAYVDYYKVNNSTLFEWYDILLCNTERHYAAFGWHSGLRFLRWGTDLEEFTPRPRPERPITFVHSAGWDPQRKGTAQVLRAWSALKPGTRLIVHSQADITPLLESRELQIQIDRGNLIVINGTMSQNAFLPLGDVYVYPTSLEGIGLTIAEAIACGLPVIVPNDPPMNEFVLDDISKTIPIERHWRRDDGYYWLCNEVADANLIESMAYFANAEVNSVKTWVSSTRASAESNFNWNNNSKGLIDILSQAPVRTIDRSIADSQFRVKPHLSRVSSAAGRIAAGILGERIIGLQ